MTKESLRSLLQATPFQAFSIHLPGDRRIAVHHPDYVLISPNGREAIVYQTDGSFNMVDLRLVTDLHVKQNGGAARKPRRSQE